MEHTAPLTIQLTQDLFEKLMDAAQGRPLPQVVIDILTTHFANPATAAEPTVEEPVAAETEEAATETETMEQACLIALGRQTRTNDEPIAEVIGAKRDLNARGNGDEWYRMVYRQGTWSYISTERMPKGKFLASERRVIHKGEVYLGEITAMHHLGGKIDDVSLVGPKNAQGKVLEPCEFVKTRDGLLKIKLPNGESISLPNPRK